MTVVEWYAAHTLIAFQRDDGVGPISVLENIYIVCADNSGFALEKAKSISNDEVKNNDGNFIDGSPARCIYGGVRKLVTISNNTPPQYGTIPGDGSEISYIEYEIGSSDDFNRIMSGGYVSINLIE